MVQTFLHFKTTRGGRMNDDLPAIDENIFWGTEHVQPHVQPEIPHADPSLLCLELRREGRVSNGRNPALCRWPASPIATG